MIETDKQALLAEARATANVKNLSEESMGREIYDLSQKQGNDASGMGLSLGAYVTDNEILSFDVGVYRGGRLIDLRVYSDGEECSDVEKRLVGGKRKKVKGFSKASRRRLFKKLGALNQELSGMPIFVTLTYPNDFPSDFKTYKRHLDTWSKRLARRYPDVFFIWRLEFQKRGAPHYHLLVFGADRICKDWLSESWYEVVGSGDEKHLKAGTRVERVRGWKKAWSYCGKYLGKVDVGHGENGRMWGVYNRGGYNKCITMERLKLSWRQFYSARRILARVTGFSLKGYRFRQGLVAFVDANDYSCLFDSS